MRAAIDFALCVRPTRSCSRHGDCARAQFATLNQDRQSFVWPTDTGNACPLFYDYAPYRKLASMGGGIADSLAPSEIVAPGKTPTTDSANDAHGVAENRAQFAGPNSGKGDASSGELGVSLDTARDAVPAGDNFGAADFASSGVEQQMHTNPADTQAAAPSTSAVGPDTAAAFGVCSDGTAGDGPSSSPDCPAENPPPSRCRRCDSFGRYVRTRYFDTEKAHVFECTNKGCTAFNLIWHTSEPWVNPRTEELQQLHAARVASGRPQG